MDELVYGPRQARDWIQKKYPEATFEDASDDIHPERFRVSVPGVERIDFFKFAFLEGFLDSCFQFHLLVRMAKEKNKEMMLELFSWIKEQPKREEENGKESA